MNTSDTPFKSGYVAIAGKPNVGKSTLLNQLLDRKLAIVSPKAQTTRHRILGILNNSRYQVVFWDTPGLIQPKYRLQETMMKAVRDSVQDADLILLMVDAVNPKTHDIEDLDLLHKLKAPKCLLINKVDRIEKEEILPVIKKFSQLGFFNEIIPISALKSDGLDRLLSVILNYLPPGEPFYPPDAVSDEPERFFVSELIREKIYFNFHKEIPYAASVIIESFTERPGRKDHIRALIVVERNSQKGIIIGKGGSALKRVGRQARESIEAFLDRPVYLELEVQVRKKWRKDPRQIKRMGYS